MEHTGTLYKIVGGKQEVFSNLFGDSENELISLANVYYNKAGLIGRYYLDISSQIIQITGD